MSKLKKVQHKKCATREDMRKKNGETWKNPTRKKVQHENSSRNVQHENIATRKKVRHEKIAPRKKVMVKTL